VVKKQSKLILVLGDQLSPDLSSLRAANPKTDIILMVEVQAEATYVRHHKKKIAFIFSAMRHFAQELEAKGWTVDYVKLDAKNNSGSFTSEIARAITRHSPSAIIVTEASEYRVTQIMTTWAKQFGVPVEIFPDDRFLASHDLFETWARDRKQLRMEYFYRDMRKITGLLMEEGAPAGGEWNYDHENRKVPKGDIKMPEPPRFAPDAITQEVLKLVAARFDNHIGTLEPFWYAVTRTDAKKALRYFLKFGLAHFGDYQDAMVVEHKYLFHSVISQYLNCGLLNPLEVCRAVEAEYHAGRAPLNAVEGYIRQIIGWREYIRGIYWLKMPDYASVNYFDAKRDLPDFYWTGDTKMTCLKSAITQTIEEAYAHHIQRLMVTGNFAMMAGVDPHQVHEWYLAVYADAYEWVEMPNVLGMSQFADGGLLGSKPYASSGAYIKKMSNYCKSCAYKVEVKAGPEACPFNYLYWDFLARHRDKLGGNPRMGQMYSTYDKLGDMRKKEIAQDAKGFLKTI
jgi:deoxyribodipyrimidine photolyase-related protein